MIDEEKISRLRELSRQRMRVIWEIAGLDVSRLSADERVLVEAMREHPEYYNLWARLDEVTDDELERDGVNPILHVVTHQIVENQIASNNPPETAQSLARLMQQGLTRHEAVHEIGSVLARDIFEIMKSQRPFSDQRYVRKLRHFVSPGKKQKRPRR
jgi:hypothetical protein